MDNKDVETVKTVMDHLGKRLTGLEKSAEKFRTNGVPAGITDEEWKCGQVTLKAVRQMYTTLQEVCEATEWNPDKWGGTSRIANSLLEVLAANLLSHDTSRGYRLGVALMQALALAESRFSTKQ